MKKTKSADPYILEIGQTNFPINPKDLSKYMAKIKRPESPIIIFFGNTKYSIIGAKIIHSVFPFTLFVTKSIDNPVKDLSLNLKIPYLEFDKLDEKAVAEIKDFEPDFLIVEDYGLIMPQSLLDIPKIAPINIHHSLLPKYRGASPAPFVILKGEKESGVTVMKMVLEVDAGDILAQEKYTLAENETTDSLRTKLNHTGGNLAVKVIEQFLDGTISPIKQDHSQASFTKRFKKEDGFFDINNPPAPEILDRMIRAYYPWPGVWTKWNGKIIKFYPNNMVQMEGKKVISLKDFLNGYPTFPLKILSS